jgi:integrase
MRKVQKLSALGVARTKADGLYGDGLGLYLQVRNGAKSWIFRYGSGGRRYLGLGPCHTVTLAEAREKARTARRQLLDGIDPIAARRQARATSRVAAASAMTFAQCASAYITAHAAGWKNAKHAGQWTATLDTYAFPIIGALPVAAIDTGLVIKVLQPIWSAKNETASRVRGRIEKVLDWAKVSEFRTGENPARWKGHLDQLLPARSNVAAVEHHAALPYRELPAFISEIERQSGSTGALALRFAILTAARTGEVIGATWSEIDLGDRLWTIPAARMKGRREHRVPLSGPVLQILDEMARVRTSSSDYVFPGQRKGKPLSNMSLLAVLKRMGRADLTTHGFRSTFRDWAAETTGFPSEVVEMALAHSVSNKVEAAYRRGDLFKKRSGLMDAWAAFVGSASGQKHNHHKQSE